MIRITGLIDQIILDDKVRSYKIDKRIRTVEPTSKSSKYSNYNEQNYNQKNNNEHSNFAKILKNK